MQSKSIQHGTSDVSHPADDFTGNVLDVSFVIPARNEEGTLPPTLQSIHEAASANGITYEMIIANDGSEDRTAEVAAESGAQIVTVQLHNIGAVRNAGAAIARGRILFFLDADTLLPPETLRAALQAIDRGAVGGGARVRFDKGITHVQRFLSFLFIFYWQGLRRWAAGCNIFVLRHVFEEVGGFDSRYFAAEERYFSDALKHHGKFVILREAVVTSGRKLRLYSTAHLIRVAFRALVIKRSELTSREDLEILYDAPREKSSNK